MQSDLVWEREREFIDGGPDHLNVSYHDHTKRFMG